MTAYPGKGGALFLARPEAQLWILALAVQAGLWAAVAPFLWRTCREFSPATRWGWVGWLLLSAVVVVLFVRLERAGLYGPGPRYPLPHHSGRILALTIAGVVLVLGPGILALCRSGSGFARRRLLMAGPGPPLASRQASCSGPGKGLPRSCSHSAWRWELSHWPLARSGALCLLTCRKRPVNSRHLPPGCLARAQPSCWRQAIFQHISRSRARRGDSPTPYTHWPDRPPRSKLVWGPREFHRAAEAGNRPSGVLPDRCRDPRSAARQPARHSPTNKMTQGPCHHCWPTCRTDNGHSVSLCAADRSMRS